jgi:hypothetical protein
MKKLLPESYFATQERLCEWFEQLQTAVGCGANADTGAVLRAVESLARKVETYEEQQAAVAKSRGYRYWGDYYNAALKELPETKVVELPNLYNEVPLGWFKGTGKPTYDKCAKRLRDTQKVLRKTLARVEEFAVDQVEGWEEQTKAELAELFTNSGNADLFEQVCLNFVYEVEPEPDPANVWVSAGECAGSLELDPDLPAVAAFELLEFAEVKGVEVTKLRVAQNEDANSPARRWFWYLLTAYLYDETRPTDEQEDEVRKNGLTAAEVGLLYLNQNNKKPHQALGWVEATSLSDLATAYQTYNKALSEGAETWTDLREAVLLALGKTEEASNV